MVRLATSTSLFLQFQLLNFFDSNKFFWNFGEGFCCGLLVTNVAMHFQFYLAICSCSEDVSFFTGDLRRSLSSQASGSCKGGFFLVVWGALHPAQTGLGVEGGPGAL